MGTNQQAVEQVFRAKDETAPAAKSFQSNVERAAAAASGAMQKAGGLMASAMGKAWDIIKKGALTIAAGIGAAVWRMAQIAPVEAAFDSLTRSIGTTADTMLGKLRDASRGLISDYDLMIQANNAMTLGVARSADEYTRITSGAIRLGKALGLDAKNAIESITVGIGRQSKLWLDNLGILINTDKAYSDYARTLGKTASQLTDVEQKAAFQAAAVAALEVAVSKLGPETVSAGDAIGRLGTKLQNTIDTLAKSELLGQAVVAVTGVLEDVAARSQTIIEGTLGYVSDLFTAASPGVTEFFSRFDFSPFISAFDKAKNLIMEWAASPALKSLMGMFGDLGTLIGTVADAVMVGLKNAFEVVGPIIDVAARAISAVIKAATDAVRVLKDLWEQATGLFTAAGQMIAGLDEQANKERVQAAVDAIWDTNRYAEAGRKAADAFIGGLAGTVQEKISRVQAEIVDVMGRLATAPDDKWAEFHKAQLATLQKSLPLLKASVDATVKFGAASDTAAKGQKAMVSVIDAHLKKQKEFSLQVNLDTLALTKSFGDQGRATEAVAKIHGKMAWDMISQAQLLGQKYPPELLKIAAAWLQIEIAADKVDDKTTEIIGKLPSKQRDYLAWFNNLAQQPAISIPPQFVDIGKTAAGAFIDGFRANMRNLGDVFTALTVGLGESITVGLQAALSAAILDSQTKQRVGADFQKMWDETLQDVDSYLKRIFGDTFGGIFSGVFASLVPVVGAALGNLIGDALSSAWSWIKGVFSGPSNEELLASAGRDMGRAWGDAFTTEVEAALAKAAAALPRAGSGKLDVNAAQFMPGVLSALLDAATSFGPEFQRRLAESVGNGVNYLMRLTGVSQADAFRQMEPVLEQAIALALKYGQTLTPQLQGLIEQARNLGVEFGGLKGIISAAFAEMVAKGDLGSDAMYRLLDVAKQAGMEADDVFSALNDTLAAQEQAIIDAERQMLSYNRQIAQNAVGIFNMQKSLAALRVEIQAVVQGLQAAAAAGDLSFSFTGQAGRERTAMGSEAWQRIQQAIREGQTKQGVVRFGKAQDIVKGVSPEHQQLVMQYIELVNQRTLMINSLKEAREANQYLLQSRNKLRDDLPKLRSAAEQTRDYLKDLRDYFLSGGGSGSGAGAGSGGGGGTQPPDNNEPEKSGKLEVAINHNIAVDANLTGSDPLSRSVARDLMTKREYVAGITKAVNDYISTDPGVWTH